VSELKVNLMTVIKSKVISPFGGLNFVINELDRMQVGKLLNKELPLLRSQSKYDWRNILYSYWSVFFCGGDCAEDLADNFKSYSSLSPYLSVPSPDRVLNRMKELTVPSIICKPKRGKNNHQFAVNYNLNDLNLKLIKKFFF
jgi:hypothetical protein